MLLPAIPGSDYFQKLVLATAGRDDFVNVETRTPLSKKS